MRVTILTRGFVQLTFAGGALDGDLTLGLPDSSVDTIVSFPEAQGRIITTGSLPSVMQVRLGPGWKRLEFPDCFD